MTERKTGKENAFYKAKNTLLNGFVRGNSSNMMPEITTHSTEPITYKPVYRLGPFLLISNLKLKKRSAC